MHRISSDSHEWINKVPKVPNFYLTKTDCFMFAVKLIQLADIRWEGTNYTLMSNE